MTLAELERVIASKKRQQKAAAQEKATFDYIQADLIGRSIARIYNSSATMPHISEAYPTLFDSEEIVEAKKAKVQELSILRFKLFADSHNKKLKGGTKSNE